MHTVTVQIVTFNSEEVIGSCLESLKVQTHPNIDVYIIDNFSEDSTCSRIEKYLESDLSIHLIKNNHNKGFSAAHNQQINEISTSYTLFLNPDVILEKNFISSLLESMEEDRSVGIASGKLITSSNQIDSTGIIANKAYRFSDRGQGLSRAFYPKKELVFGVTGAAMMVKRKCLEDLTVNNQFFDEDFFAYKEDIDVCWRANSLGWLVQYDPNSVAYHDRGWSNQTARKKIPLFIRQHSYINRYFLLLKNIRILDLVSRLPFLLAYDLTLLGYLLLKEPKTLVVWKNFFKQIPTMVMKRRMIKKKGV